MRLQVGDQVWTGHLFGLFVLGVLFGCWFLLGVSIIRLRMRERRELRARPKHGAASAPTAHESRPVLTRR